jgi:hypothetical protein
LSKRLIAFFVSDNKPLQTSTNSRVITMAIEDYANIINGVMWTQVVLAAIFIGARIYTRYFIIRSIGWDDIIMGVNLVSNLLHTPVFLKLAIHCGIYHELLELT